MRAVYCPNCKHVALLSSFEAEICPRCGTEVVRSQARRPWQYYANGVLLLSAAIYLVVGPPDALIRWGIFLGALGAAAGLAIWSLQSTRKRVLREMSRTRGSP